jgi:hypothetical protein
MKRSRIIRLAMIVCMAAACVARQPRAESEQCAQLAAWDRLPIQELEDSAASEAYSQLRSTRAGLNLMARSAEAYCQLRGHYPQDIAVFTDAPLEHFGGPTCATREEWLLDSWDTPLRYDVTGGVPRIISTGPDRLPGTGDDLRSAYRGEEGSRPFDLPAECGRRLEAGGDTP